jgi:very-short-patch-repair endonuclease
VGDKRQGGLERHGGLFELATRQHGVVSTRQLAVLGYTRSSAAKAARVGRLRRLHKGVYVVGHEHLTWHAYCHAAILAVRPSVASHLSAGWLWGLLRYRADTIHVTAPTPRRQRRGFVVHASRLARADLSWVDGIPVTALPRTYLDLAVDLSPDSMDKALERAEERGILDLGPVDELLCRSVGHPGHAPLSRALAIYRPDPTVTRSDIERDFRELVEAGGLQPPSMNFVVGGYELDAYWEEERFGVELEVYETHGSRAAFERDGARQEDLMLLGIETIRISGSRLRREPQAVVARVAAHLERRRGELR